MNDSAITRFRLAIKLATVPCVRSVFAAFAKPLAVGLILAISACASKTGGIISTDSNVAGSGMPMTGDPDDGGDMTDPPPPPPMPPGFTCDRCGGGEGNTLQVNYVAGTSLAAYDFTGGTETNRVDLAAMSGVRRDATAIRTILHAALDNGDLTTDGEIPILNVDAYANAAQTTLAIVLEMEFGALGLWVQDPGEFFLGTPNGYPKSDFQNIGRVRFAHFGDETLVANLPTGTANFDGVINAISHNDGRRATDSSRPDHIPPNTIFVASEPFSMAVNFGTGGITSPPKTLFFNRQYHGDGGAMQAFEMLAANPGALLGGNSYHDDIGPNFGPGSPVVSQINSPSNITFNGEPTDGNGIMAGSNEFRLRLTRQQPFNTDCCHEINAADIDINGKFYGPAAEEAIGVGKQNDASTSGGDFIMGIFTRKRQ